jgi:hypothetical protein
MEERTRYDIRRVSGEGAVPDPPLMTLQRHDKSEEIIVRRPDFDCRICRGGGEELDV